MVNRQPILNRAAVVAAVGLIVAAARHYGVVIPDAESGAVVDLVTVGGPLVLAVWAARHTTPSADPRTETGEALLPASVVNPPAPPTPESVDAAWAAYEAATAPHPVVAEPAPVAVEVAPEPAPEVAPVEAARPAPSLDNEWSPTA